MILSTNAFNWAALRSGMSTGDFMASLTPEREEELFKQYNEWRRSKGLAEEKAPTPPPTPVSAAPKQRKEPAASPVDDLSALINEVAAEVEEEEAEAAALIQDALDGADELVEEETAAVPEEIEADKEVPTIENELPSEDDHITDETEVAAPEVAAASAIDFAAVIRSLPKEPDPALYSRIKEQFGEATKELAQVALKEATNKHRGTAAIRTFLEWLNDV